MSSGNLELVVNREYLYILKIYFIEVQLIYSVVLISAVQQSDSVIHIYIYILFHYGLSQDTEFPVLYSRTLLFIPPIYNSLHLLMPHSQPFPLPPPSSLATTSLFSMSVSLLLFHRQVHLCHTLDSTCKWQHMVFVFLFLTYFT